MACSPTMILKVVIFRNSIDFSSLFPQLSSLVLAEFSVLSHGNKIHVRICVMCFVTHRTVQLQRSRSISCTDWMNINPRPDVFYPYKNMYAVLFLDGKNKITPWWLSNFIQYQTRFRFSAGTILFYSLSYALQSLCLSLLLPRNAQSLTRSHTRTNKNGTIFLPYPYMNKEGENYNFYRSQVDFILTNIWHSLSSPSWSNHVQQKCLPITFVSYLLSRLSFVINFTYHPLYSTPRPLVNPQMSNNFGWSCSPVGNQRASRTREWIRTKELVGSPQPMKDGGTGCVYKPLRIHFISDSLFTCIVLLLLFRGQHCFVCDLRHLWWECQFYTCLTHPCFGVAETTFRISLLRFGLSYSFWWTQTTTVAPSPYIISKQTV